MFRGGEGPGPFQVEGCEGRRGTDPEPVGAAVVLVGDEVASAHDHDICGCGGVVDEIGCGQYPILQEQQSTICLMSRRDVGHLHMFRSEPSEASLSGGCWQTGLLVVSCSTAPLCLGDSGIREQP